jgi:methionyl-tRNA synthetase
MMANIANLIKPFMPDASDKIKDMLSFADYKWGEEVINGDIKVKNYDMLYNRIDE